MVRLCGWTSPSSFTKDGDKDAGLPLTTIDTDNREIGNNAEISSRVPSRLQHPAAQALRWLYNLIPFFIAAPFGLTERRLPVTTSTTYLNGLRGLACWVVLNHHLTQSIDRPWIFRPYGIEPLEENSHFVQLPLIRVIHAGKGMVCVFFTLSGFVLSYSTLRSVNCRAGLTTSAELLTNFSSAILRRGIRLFVPMMVLVIVQAFVCRYISFVSDFDNKAASLLEQLLDFWDEAIPLMDPFNWLRPTRLPAHFQHCWTLGYEYRLSLALFIMLIASCRLQTVPRKIFLVTFMAWSNYVGQRWDIVCFFGGMFVAELRFAPLSADVGRLIRRPHFKPNKWISIVLGTVAVPLGLLFCSWPENQPDAVYPYKTFYWITPETFRQPLTTAPRKGWLWYWGSIGALLLLWGLEQLPLLQRILTFAPLAYIGEISYSFYLVHRIGRTAVGEPLLKYIQEERQWNHGSAFIFYYFSTLIWTVIAADYFWRAVDLNSVILARKLVVDFLGVGKERRVGEVAYTALSVQRD